MYDNQSVGMMDIQEETKQEIKQSSQTEIQPDHQTPKKEVTRKENYLESWENGKKSVQVSGKPENHINGKPDFQPSLKTSLFSSSKQQTQKAPTRLYNTFVF
jgi:hypothetical protein